MNRRLYAVMSLGGAVGLVAAFLQTLEKLTLLKNKDAVLTCNFNSVFSCSNVLNAHQSSVFGFPNSIMCMLLFATFLVVGLVGLTGGIVARGMRLGVQALALFTLGFSLWFLWQSTYRINALCIFCVFCFAGLLMVNGAWLRGNAADLPGKVWLERAKHSGADIFAWLLLAATVALAMIIHFR